MVKKRVMIQECDEGACLCSWVKKNVCFILWLNLYCIYHPLSRGFDIISDIANHCH